MKAWGALAVAVVGGLLLGGAFASAVSPASHYVPRTGDRFAYSESITVNAGYGNYSGYTDWDSINGSETVTAVAANGTVSALYYYASDYQQNASGYTNRSTMSGAFSFSDLNFSYLNGTDDQVGYVHPQVWFYMDNTLSVGAPFSLLNTAMTVDSTNASFHLGTTAGAYVRTIASTGTGSYVRDDSYGYFTASYTWNAYFDPATGYIVGYEYVEHDSDGAGDGFTYTDLLFVTATTYALSPASAPSGAAAAASAWPVDLVVGLVVLLVLVVLVVAVALWLRGRRRRFLPTHSSQGRVEYPTPAPVPPGHGPPPVNLTPTGQPAVQQIVIKETVKVKCAYCGSLIDSTVANCPFCGAART